MSRVFSLNSVNLAIPSGIQPNFAVVRGFLNMTSEIRYLKYSAIIKNKYSGVKKTMRAKGQSPLFLLFAIEKGDYEDVKAKLDNTLINQSHNFPITHNIGGVKFELKNPQLLHVAVFADDKDEHSDERRNIIDLLIENGSDINGKDGGGNTPLHLACCMRNVSIVKQLLKKGAKADEINNLGYTSLHYATMFERLDLLNELINHGADVNVKTRDKSNALHIAASSRSNEEVAKKLIDLGIDLNEKNDDNKSFLDIAKSTDHTFATNLEKYAKQHVDFFSAVIQNETQQLEAMLQEIKSS